jgi:hypothetical protein
VSATVCASLLSLSGLILVLFAQLGLYLLEHLGILRAGFAHLFGVGFKNHAHLFIDAVLERKLLDERLADPSLAPLQVSGGDHLGVDEVLDGAAG